MSDKKHHPNCATRNQSEPENTCDCEVSTLAQSLRLDTMHHSPALQALQDRVHEFQIKRFPVQNAQAKLKHCIKEINELIANMADGEEWADILILYLAAASIQGRDTTQLIMDAHAKMDINEKRKWKAPDADGVIEHK